MLSGKDIPASRQDDPPLLFCFPQKTPVGFPTVVDGIVAEKPQPFGQASQRAVGKEFHCSLIKMAGKEEGYMIPGWDGGGC